MKGKIQPELDGLKLTLVLALFLGVPTFVLSRARVSTAVIVVAVLCLAAGVIEALILRGKMVQANQGAGQPKPRSLKAGQYGAKVFIVSLIYLITLGVFFGLLGVGVGLVFTILLLHLGKLAQKASLTPGDRVIYRIVLFTVYLPFFYLPFNLWDGWFKGKAIWGIRNQEKNILLRVILAFAYLPILFWAVVIGGVAYGLLYGVPALPYVWTQGETMRLLAVLFYAGIGAAGGLWLVWGKASFANTLKEEILEAEE